jgi:membrane-bound ClpP family serine protease
MIWWILLAVFLYFLCAMLLVAEVFVPSGGLISVCSLLCLAGGVVIFFRVSPAAGWAGVALAVVMIPATLIVAYRVFPKTRFGKSVTLNPTRAGRGAGIPHSEELERLLGSDGVVLTPLRPVGMCEFSGHRVECIAESGYLARGETVTVIEVQGRKLLVRKTEQA